MIRKTILILAEVKVRNHKSLITLAEEVHTQMFIDPFLTRIILNLARDRMSSHFLKVREAKGLYRKKIAEEIVKKRSRP
jgi:hypothetical protein